MAGNSPRICISIVDSDVDTLKGIEPLADLFEVRIDFIGKNWQKVVAHLNKPWIACNRRAEEGGRWSGREAARIKELRRAVELGASIIDVELATPGIADIVREIKGRAECLVSYHNIKETPPLDRLRQIVINQLAVGADISKVVTTARRFKDNLAVLELLTVFPETKVVAFAMGAAGQISRVLSPLMGGCFTYASIKEGRESAKGQITAANLREIYDMLYR